MLRNAIDILLRFSLIESKSGNREQDVTEIFVSDKGSIYLKELIYEYKYLVLICDAVPMPNQHQRNVGQKFGNATIPINSGSLKLKDESVKGIAKFISSEERCEKEDCDYNYRGDLDEIRGENGISKKMMEEIESTIKNMTKSIGKYKHYNRTSNITFRAVEGEEND